MGLTAVVSADSAVGVEPADPLKSRACRAFRLSRSFGPEPVAMKAEATVARDRASLVEFGRRVRELREQAGLTQAEVAAASGITRAALSTIEAGKRDLGVSRLAALAAALGIEPGHLFPVDESTTEH